MAFVYAYNANGIYLLPIGEMIALGSAATYTPSTVDQFSFIPSSMHIESFKYTPNDDRVTNMLVLCNVSAFFAEAADNVSIWIGKNGEGYSGASLVTQSITNHGNYIFNINAIIPMIKDDYLTVYMVSAIGNSMIVNGVNLTINAISNS